MAIGSAAATFAVFVAVIGMGGALQAGLAPWPGIAVALLAITSFTASRRRRSLVVAAFLAASGIVGIVYALVRTAWLTEVQFPGPVFGLLLGVPILGLSVAEAVGTLTPARRRSITRRDVRRGTWRSSSG